MPIDYCLGKDLHYAVITHRKEILGMIKNKEAHENFEGLETIAGSVKLLSIVAGHKKIYKIAPYRLQYPDPRAPDAKRPKRVEILPPEAQIIEPGGMWMFNVTQNTFKRNLYFALGCLALFIVLLWRVWPTWLRIGVWYVSYYLCIALVSSSFALDTFVDCRCHTAPDPVVHPVPLRHRFLAFPELLH